jgi:hypothetical protein
MEMVERVTQAIFADLLRQAQEDRNLYVGGSVYTGGGETIDGGVSLESFARAAIKAFHKALCEGDYFWMECQECAAGRRINDLVKSFPEESALNKSTDGEVR